uniref:NADH-ubiquinone oxidoreductase chain 6 n=1 Tax=Calumma parsonii TaxID=179907 RepID=D6RRZ4_CALPR|nr:NADH dehydrogenase subunit 6 [Calumma parsonii]
MYFFMLGLFLFFMGGVSSNPSPYFGSAALALAAVFGAGILAWLGSTFVSLVLMFVYLGGMLVVFAYSIAMSSDVYPEAWGSRYVVFYVVGFMVYLFCLWGYVGGGEFLGSVMSGSSAVLLEGVVVDLGGLILLYSFGGGCFLILGVGLLLTLFVILDLVYGWCFGATRVTN